MVDIFSPQKRQELMSKVRNKDTDIELLLRRKLWSLGYRYRVNYKVFGRPDIAFPRRKVAIFCDGDFWHGRSYKKDKGGYKKFWREKIADNIKRDKKVNRRLKKEGWTVLRFWKTEILGDVDRCVEKIITHLSTNSD